MQTETHSLRSLQLLAFFMFASLMLLFALPAHAADAIPAVKETADTVLATVRVAAVPTAIVAFIWAS
jgi:hypothetical protein